MSKREANRSVDNDLVRLRLGTPVEPTLRALEHRQRSTRSMATVVATFHHGTRRPDRAHADFDREHEPRPRSRTLAKRRAGVE
jgi:hypothetical protein